MWAKILLIFFVASFLFKTDQSFNQDLGRHIKTGELIIGNFNIPKINLFSYTNPDFPFINTHWLFGVIAYFFHQANVMQLFLLLKVVIILASVFIVIKIVPKDKGILLLPIGFIFLHVLRERTDLRPEIFSFLFTALTYYILERFSNQISSDRGTFATKSIFLLPIIQLAWINTHIYFFVGIVLQAIFLIHLTYQTLRFNLKGYSTRLLGLILILSVCFSLINPNGINGLLYPLNVNTNYGYSIVENQNLFLLESINFNNTNFLFVKLSLGILILSFLVAFIKKNWELKNVLVGVFGAVLALMHVRSFPYLVFLSLPVAVQNFGVIKKSFYTKFLFTLATVLVIGESGLYLNGDYYKFKDSQDQNNLSLIESGKAALDFAVANNLPQPIYNNFDIGSYIIYRTYPTYKVFVDGRPEAYPRAFFDQIYIPAQSDYAKFKQMEGELGLKTVIFSHTDQTPWGQNFLKHIVVDKDWTLVFIDDFMAIFIKEKDVHFNPINLAELKADSFSFNSSHSYLRLGLFLLNMDKYTASDSFFKKAYELNEDSPIANQYLSNLLGFSRYSKAAKTWIFW